MTKFGIENGIRFECQATGNCCVSRGSYGFVYLTLNDRKNIAKLKNIPTQSFTKRFCKKHLGHFHLKEIKGACEFLAEKKCSIYSARPSQCRTWPFWPENMNTKTWNQEVKAFCPGVGKGKLYTKEEIENRLKQDPLI